jgi:hypothetical protein
VQVKAVPACGQVVNKVTQDKLTSIPGSHYKSADRIHHLILYKPRPGRHVVNEFYRQAFVRKIVPRDGQGHRYKADICGVPVGEVMLQDCRSTEHDPVNFMIHCLIS